MTDTVTGEASHETLVRIELLARRAERIARDATDLENELASLIYKLGGSPALPDGFWERISRDADALAATAT